MSSTSISSAAGFLGNPGMVIISPVKTMIYPAPEANLTPLSGTPKFVGLPLRLGSVDKEPGVLAIHTGKCPNP